MRNIKRVAIILILLSITIFSLSSCINFKYKQQKIIETFESFENSEDYVFVTSSPNKLYVRKNVIDLDNLTYEERPCRYISTTTTCAYFFAYHSETESTVDLLSLSYQTLELSFVDTIEAENKITSAEHYNGEVYFILRDEDAAPVNSYLIYNVETAEIRHADYDSVSSQNFQSGKYTITYNDSDEPLTGETKLLVKNNQTGEEKTVGYSLLKTCEQGKKIFELGDVFCTSWASDYYEHNGEIYIVYVYLVDGFLGYPSYAYVMKYDFDSHTMQYYTSVFMEDFPEGSLRGFKIPQ